MRQQTKQYSIEEIREPELQNLFKLSQNVFYHGMDNSGGGAGASLDAMLNNQQQSSDPVFELTDTTQHDTKEANQSEIQTPVVAGSVINTGRSNTLIKGDEIALEERKKIDGKDEGKRLDIARPARLKMLQLQTELDDDDLECEVEEVDSVSQKTDRQIGQTSDKVTSSDVSTKKDLNATDDGIGDKQKPGQKKMTITTAKNLDNFRRKTMIELNPPIQSAPKKQKASNQCIIDISGLS